MVDPKALTKIHNASVKEMEEITDYNSYFKPSVEKLNT